MQTRRPVLGPHTLGPQLNERKAPGLRMQHFLQTPRGGPTTGDVCVCACDTVYGITLHCVYIVILGVLGQTGTSHLAISVATAPCSHVPSPLPRGRRVAY